jgi:hypothetical protein
LISKEEKSTIQILDISIHVYSIWPDVSILPSSSRLLQQMVSESYFDLVRGGVDLGIESTIGCEN